MGTAERLSAATENLDPGTGRLRMAPLHGAWSWIIPAGPATILIGKKKVAWYPLWASEALEAQSAEARGLACSHTAHWGLWLGGSPN